MYIGKKTAFLTIVAVAALLMAVPANAQTGDNSAVFKYSPAGTWIETSVSAGEPPFLATITPLGRGKASYAIVSEILADMGFGAVASTSYRGVAIRAGQNVYHFTQVLYTTDAASEVVVINVASGTAEFIDRDHFIATANVALYSPDQDPFGEEPPLYGCFPISHTFERVPVVPPCEP
jgi:hypothetical protein